jgi:hypothetical protein
VLGAGRADARVVATGKPQTLALKAPPPTVLERAVVQHAVFAAPIPVVAASGRAGTKRLVSHVPKPLTLPAPAPIGLLKRVRNSALRYFAIVAFTSAVAASGRAYP